MALGQDRRKDFFDITPELIPALTRLPVRQRTVVVLVHGGGPQLTQVTEAMGVPMWVGSAVRQLWAYSASHMGPDTDFTTVVKCVEEWAGVEVKGT